jgi:hypothetical protein
MKGANIILQRLLLRLGVRVISGVRIDTSHLALKGVLSRDLAIDRIWDES